MVNRLEREKVLLNSFRMLDNNPENGLNQTHGLFMMCRDVMKDDFIVTEIGSFGGISSEVLALHCRKLFCIDTWEDWNGDGGIFKAMENFDNMQSMYTHIQKIHMSGKDASVGFDDETLDLVYIDASHWYDDVIEDIKTWLPKVKKGGYLCGHDYIEGIDTFYAVNDFFGKTHSITRYPDTTWLIKKDTI
jgi:predicted O-methyltransferase YrrM